MFQEDWIDQINFCYLDCKDFLSCCFAFTTCIFLSRSSCENWINNNEVPPSNFPHYVSFVLIHTVLLILVRRQLHKIMLEIYEKIRRDHFICSSQQSYSFPTVWNNSLSQGQMWQQLQLPQTQVKEKLQCVQYFLLVTRAGLHCYSAHWKRFQIWKETFCIWKCTLNGVNNIPEVRVESLWSLNLAAALEDSTPPWVAALWWLSVSLVMSLAALTQVICMQADSAWDVRQRQWCTYHFPCWLIEDCNLCWTFSLITHVSGSKTRTLSCHWALGSSRVF